MTAGKYQEHVPLVDVFEGARSAAPESTTLLVRPQVVTAGAKVKRDLSVDQQELVDIMERLEMRNQDFAVHLGIGVSRLSSYIYGATATVNPDVMTKARELLEERSQGLDGAKKLFSQKMSVIIDEWKLRLMIKTNEQLAKYLGVTTMTLHRWRTESTKPDLSGLIRLDQQVEQLALRLESARAEMDRQIASGK